MARGRGGGGVGLLMGALRHEIPYYCNIKCINHIICVSIEVAFRLP